MAINVTQATQTLTAVRAWLDNLADHYDTQCRQAIQHGHDPQEAKLLLAGQLTAIADINQTIILATQALGHQPHQERTPTMNHRPTRHDPRLTDPDLIIDMLIAQASQHAARQTGATYTERLERAMRELGLHIHPL